MAIDDEVTGRRSRNGNGDVEAIDLQPEATVDYCAQMLRHIAVKQAVSDREIKMDMRDLRRTIRIWNALPLIQVVLVGVVSGIFAGSVVAGVVLALH